jgi:hypothetical protein
MAKAIEGAALLAGAAALFWVVPGVGWALLPYELALISSMAVGGVAMEAAAIAGALTSNRGMNITTRQAASFRQIIYGQQRVGGVMIYQSTTGSSHDQWNATIVLAGHEIDSIENLYLDGRQVFWQGSGVGWAVRNGVGFGGIADGANHTGPDGSQYNFGGSGHSGLYCEVRYGDQTDPAGSNSPGVATWTGSPASVIGALTANDANWAEDGEGNYPWVAGCAYLYLKIEYNTNLFPSFPEIRITVNGKNNIYDPRTSTTGFTTNWALVAADVITDPVFGLGDGTVNQAQLIAAANVCDEQIEVAALSATSATYEAQYATNWHYDTSMAPGDALSTMMSGAAGRLSRIGGEWYITPAYWQGASATWDENALLAPPQWKPNRSVRDLFNRVSGTYTAPNFPWNVTGNLYDSNGFYDGSIQNNFAFAFQPTNYPEYAADVLHGFSSDQYLTADGGIQHPKELSLPTVLSVTQAQRVAKINLLRNRQQGSGSFTMGLPSYRIQPCDVMQFTFPFMGWTEKTLEVTGVGFTCDRVKSNSGGEEALAIMLHVTVIESDSSVYEWNPSTDELTVYDLPATPTQLSGTPAPPTSMSLTSGAATALVALDGSVTPRVEVQWDTPADILTTQIQIQYQLVVGGTPQGWLNAGYADSSQTVFYVTGVVAGQTYDFRIRSCRANGATSEWVEIDGYVVSITLSVVTDLALAEGSLRAQALSGGGATITVYPFTAIIGMASVSVLSGGAYNITGLAQQTLYFIYYVDPTFAGGAITPIATTNEADFLNRVGYFYIGSITTPLYGTLGGGGGITLGFPAYATRFSDSGSLTTLNAASLLNSPAGYATVSGDNDLSGFLQDYGQCTWFGFPSGTTTTALNLYVTASSTIEGGATYPSGGVGVLITSSLGDIVNDFSTALTGTTYSIAVPIGTDLSTVTVTGIVNPLGVGATTPGRADLDIDAVYIGS